MEIRAELDASRSGALGNDRGLKCVDRRLDQSQIVLLLSNAT
ncbi:MAG: hypothetical protein ABIS15_07235 [Gemmatimonadaceae bacterium]